jgi:O-acetylhomoserine/O-acetylserine sulfhydrylase-like pyridoxal-dependent enzyme
VTGASSGIGRGVASRWRWRTSVRSVHFLHAAIAYLPCDACRARDTIKARNLPFLAFRRYDTIEFLSIREPQAARASKVAKFLNEHKRVPYYGLFSKTWQSGRV